MANKVLKRSEADKKYTWRLEDIYPDTAEWREDYAKAVKVAEEIESYKGRIGESSKNMLAVFQLEDKLMLLLDRIYCYAHQLYDQDTANAESQALSGEAENMGRSAVAVCVDKIGAAADNSVRVLCNIQRRGAAVLKEFNSRVFKHRNRPQVFCDYRLAVIVDVRFIVIDFCL